MRRTPQPHGLAQPYHKHGPELGHDQSTEAVDVDSALLKMQTQKPDLILSDYNMPGKNGVDFLRIVRENPSSKAIPFMLNTEMQSMGLLLDTDPKVGENFTITPDARGHHRLSFVMGCTIDETEPFSAGLDIDHCWYRIYKTTQIPARTAAPLPIATPEPPQQTVAAIDR